MFISQLTPWDVLGLRFVSLTCRAAVPGAGENCLAVVGFGGHLCGLSQVEVRYDNSTGLVDVPSWCAQ